MIPLKQSTAVTVLIGSFVDKTDGVTAEVGLAGAGTEISKAGAAFGAGPTLGTHDSDGWYPISLTTTHTNTLGELVIKCVDDATHLPAWVRCWVFTANIYDSLFGSGGDLLDVNVGQVGGTAQTAGDLAARLPAALVSGRMDSHVGDMASNVISASKMAADVTTELRSIVSGVADSGSTTTMVDAARTEADTDYWKGMRILFTDGSIAGQVRLITGFDPATDTITFAPATTQAVGTNGYEILPNSRVDVQSWLGTVVNALISGRIDANMQALANDVITAAAIATGAIDADALAADAGTELADALLKRDMSAVSGESARSLLNAIRFLRNKWTITGTTLSVKKEDDSTEAWSAALSTDAAANPIISSDPA